MFCKYYQSTYHRNASRNHPVRVVLDDNGVPIAVERIHPLTGELEVMEGYLDKLREWGKDIDFLGNEIDQAQFEALRARMLAPPTDEMTYEYFLYSIILVRIAIDSRGCRCGAEYLDRRTGTFVRDNTWMSKIEFDRNAEVEEIDQADFERFHAQIVAHARAGHQLDAQIAAHRIAVGQNDQ